MAILKNSIAAGLAALTLASGTMMTATPAAARGWGGPFAGGLIGGLAAGAILGSVARPYGYGYAGAGYAPYSYPAYGGDGYGYGYAPAPVYSPCYRGRAPIYDGYGTFIGYRPVRVCN